MGLDSQYQVYLEAVCLGMSDADGPTSPPSHHTLRNRAHEFATERRGVFRTIHATFLAVQGKGWSNFTRCLISLNNSSVIYRRLFNFRGCDGSNNR
jgi:hypothetical protein